MCNSNSHNKIFYIVLNDGSIVRASTFRLYLIFYVTSDTSETPALCHYPDVSVAPKRHYSNQVKKKFSFQIFAEFCCGYDLHIGGFPYFPIDNISSNYENQVEEKNKSFFSIPLMVISNWRKVELYWSVCSNIPPTSKHLFRCGNAWRIFHPLCIQVFTKYGIKMYSSATKQDIILHNGCWPCILVHQEFNCVYWCLFSRNRYKIFYVSRWWMKIIM